MSDQDGLRFVPLPAGRQRDAVRFLNANAFATPAFVIKPEVLRRLEPAGTLERIKSSQKTVLASLLSQSRIARLTEYEAVDAAGAYRPGDFLTEVRRGVWAELAQPSVKVDAYRRNLQRAYLEVADDMLNGRQAGTGDERPLMRGELRALDGEARLALTRVTERTTRAHLQDVRDRIARMLDPRFAPPAAAAGPVPAAAFDESPAEAGAEGCWLDFAIRVPKR